jgi:hypothetical protein
MESRMARNRNRWMAKPRRMVKHLYHRRQNRRKPGRNLGGRVEDEGEVSHRVMLRLPSVATCRRKAAAETAIAIEASNNSSSSSSNSNSNRAAVEAVAP